MSEYMFDVSSATPTRAEAQRRDRIAQKYGFVFVEVDGPEGYKCWFAGPNKGHPWDEQAAHAIRQELERD